MKKTMFIIIMGLFMILTGCSEKEEAKKEIKEITKKIDGLEYHLKISDTTVKRNEKIIVEGYVINKSGKDIIYYGTDGCDDGFHILIKNEEHYLSRVRNKNKMDRVCTEAIVEHVLKPGEKLEEKQIFNPEIQLDSEYVTAPDGTYQVGVLLKREMDESGVKLLLPVKIDTKAV